MKSFNGASGRGRLVLREARELAAAAQVTAAYRSLKPLCQLSGNHQPVHAARILPIN
jgi:hypothetical protein